LRFDWSELLTRRETDTLKATAALLHRDALDAKTGTSLHDSLDESAHKHAYGVSEDLKYALRECIELLGNEAARQLTERARAQKTGIFSGQLDADQLTTECLRYMYRVLFLFYIEARPELGYAPVDSSTYLNTVVLPNHVLQRVIALMSLPRPGGTRGKGGRKRRGRISYAQLGINQLGAVYEALLSFRGFFATEDLYEVTKAGATPNPLETGYFVNADALEQYTDDEKVFDKDHDTKLKRLRKFDKGTFIYRMAGRDRQQSASYYTPEVLTRCLVKYALKELFKQQLDPLPSDAARAERILQLTVCEPAMGSAAFLNEAVNQLADAYLDHAQRAANERIPQSEYAAEKQKVKMYLQLHCGNSLIGARRETHAVANLYTDRPKDPESWLNRPPDVLPMTEPLPEGQVWHFLLPDRGMANYQDKTHHRPLPRLRLH